MSDLADAGEAKRAGSSCTGTVGVGRDIVALGSNLGDRRATIDQAIGRIEVAHRPMPCRGHA